MLFTIDKAKKMVEEIQFNDVYTLNDWEDDFIKSIHAWLAKGFGLTEKQATCLQRIHGKLEDAGYIPDKRQPADERTPYEILGVDEDADLETIKQAFRKLVMQCHPDRAGGLHPEIIMFAQEKMKKINAAFECIKQERGE